MDTSQSKSDILDEKYRASADRVYLSGLQALVRALLMQSDRDAALGLATAGFVSGYRGSPLAGFDQQLLRASAALDERQIHFEPGVNEELAATAVWGSQQVGLKPGARYDGVFGLWYGKAPGFDRATDAIRHAHAAGTARHGGVVAVIGDDHACKSSSLPTQSEFLCAHLEMPVLAPSSLQEVVDFTLTGFAMSRYAGSWVGLKALADLMDGSGVVDVGPECARFELPVVDARSRTGLGIRSGHDPLDQEERLRHGKLAAAISFARANGVNEIVFDAVRPGLVVVATGKAYADTRQAFANLGLDAATARRVGVRLVRVGMPWPLDGEQLREWTRGAERVLVIEEKRALIESQLRDSLYTLNDAERPALLGKRDAVGADLLSDVFELSPAEIERALIDIWPMPERTLQMQTRLDAASADEHLIQVEPSQTSRTPFFCSGCPHNRSTQLPEGSRGLVGIGCHYMVQWMDRDHDQVCQMGGEGAAWIGQAPFTDEAHVFANLGDGTYFHSGLLAIRAAVAAESRITYKLLFNDAVAMTGGQALEGPLDVPRLTRQLLAEGVARVVVVAEDVNRYRSLDPLPAGVDLEPREKLDLVQRSLRDEHGVTVLVYDQACAAEKRRRRKRGTLADPNRRVFINEAVCDGCGDCSSASNCLSVEPVETDFGRKRRINQSSCNKDESCVEGTCPSFVSVIGGRLRQRPVREIDHLLEALPDPLPINTGDVTNLVITGIGGTGVTTVAALLGMASHLEGKRSAVLDMTGLAQKGGAVISHVRIAEEGMAIHGQRVPDGSADVLIACDPVVAAGEDGLRMLDRSRTRSVINANLVATAAFVMDRDVAYDLSDLQRRVGLASREVHSTPATRMAEGMLGDAILANVMMLGMAAQLGLVPVSCESLEAAILANGVSVEANLRSFRLGRLVAHDPKLVEDWEVADAMPAPSRTLEERIARRAAQLVDYQDESLAARYRSWIDRAQSMQKQFDPDDDAFVTAIADGGFRMLAYKDEYEVARLYADPDFRASLERDFEGDYALRIHLAPPVPGWGRAQSEAGRPVKWAFGPWILPLFKLLAKGKRLRGTRFDLFGRQAERVLERELAQSFEKLVENAFARGTRKSLAQWTSLLRQADRIRGFGHVKQAAAEEVLGNWAEARDIDAGHN